MKYNINCLDYILLGFLDANLDAFSDFVPLLSEDEPNRDLKLTCL